MMIALSTVSSMLLLALSVYLLIMKRSLANVILALTFMILIVNQAFSMMWSVTPEIYLLYRRSALLLESLLPLAFLGFSFSFARAATLKSIRPSEKVLLILALLFPLCAVFVHIDDLLFYSIPANEIRFFLGKIGYWLYAGIMAYCVISLMHLESTLSASVGRDRWKIKYEIFGVGAILAFLIFHYGHVLMNKTIDAGLLPVRSGVLILAAVFIGYSKMFRGNGVTVLVSRFIVMRSFTLLAVGTYLVYLGAVRATLFRLGISEEWTVFLAVLGGAALIIVLFSERMRRRTKVFVNKHFYPQKHDYRLAWLTFTARLSSRGTFDDVKGVILRFFQETFGMEGAALYLLKDKRYLLSKNMGMGIPDMELQEDSPLTCYFQEERRVFNRASEEYCPSERESDFFESIGARLAIPLYDAERVIGFVALGKPLARETYTYEDYDLMKTLASQASLSILNVSFSEELAEARELSAMAQVSSFVMHDLKNQVYALSLVTENAEKHMDEPEFQKDMILSVRSTIQKMGALMQKLKKVPEKRELSMQDIDIDALVGEVVTETKEKKPDTKIHYRGCSSVCSVDIEELRGVMINLLYNAVDATKGRGTIVVETAAKDSGALIRVEDDGCGMTDDFMRNNLFKPFRTTKKKGLGIGLYQCKHIIEAHGGKITVESEPNKGTTFEIFLPKHKLPAFV
jgi:putative PEP-CTERM system histidine kinase